MKSFRLSREALRDLDNIFCFVARRSNMDIADLLIDAIY
jgi:plasmid stabilization system protein ParE